MRKYFSGPNGKLMPVMIDEKTPDEMYMTIKALKGNNLFRVVLPDENYLENKNKINFGGHRDIYM